MGFKSKFERNWRNQFGHFRNQISDPENQNLNLILGFEVPISYFSQNYPNSLKIIRIEILVLASRFLIFPKPNFRNFKFSQSRILYFHQILYRIFEILGSIYQNFPRISLNTRNIFEIFLQRQRPHRGRRSPGPPPRHGWLVGVLT